MQKICYIFMWLKKSRRHFPNNENYYKYTYMKILKKTWSTLFSYYKNIFKKLICLKEISFVRKLIVLNIGISTVTFTFPKDNEEGWIS